MTDTQKQCLLVFLGYDTGGIGNGWGPKSNAAMTAFCRDFGGIEEADGPQALKHAVAYGMPERDKAEDIQDVTDNNVGHNEDWWEEIEYFGPHEIECKCKRQYCNGYPHKMQPLVMQILDRARRWSGHPIVVISGLRCPEWNRIQNGVKNSQHMFGEAADVYFYGVSPDVALAWLQRQPDVRYAYRIEGCNNIHFDIQPVGR